MSFDPSHLNRFSSDPGVYLMKKQDDTILYIGKAKNLKTRLKQYFLSGGDGRFMIPYLLAQVDKIETVVTLSEKEALLLENTLIKKHKPRYNALLKDDKSYAAIKLDHKHPWPHLQLIRYKGKPKDNSLYFGPYTSAFAARQTVELLQKIFPLRQCSNQEFAKRTRACILYSMKRCSGPCVNLITSQDYQAYVESTIKFLRGQNQEVIENLQQQMEKAAEDLEFERAAEILRTIQSIQKTLQTQTVDKQMKGISGDILAIFRQGDEVVLSQLIFQAGTLTAYKHHDFSQIASSDEELLESFILQNYQNASSLPKEIYLPLELTNGEILEEILSKDKQKIKIIYPKQGEKKDLVEMAYRNAETAFKQKKDEAFLREKNLLEMQEKLFLTRYPQKIECIDHSHFSGSEAVSSLVTYVDGKPDKTRYRHYQLQGVKAADDYGALEEILIRRYNKLEQDQNLPDLLIIDGGRGHLSTALKVLESLNIASIDLIGLAKQEGRHDKGMTNEQVFLPEAKEPIILSSHSSLLFFLQRIRDEAHRFAITYQKKRRTKVTIKSLLSEIKGIGPAKQKNLLRHFGSVKNIKKATDEEILAVKGINSTDILTLKAFFQKQ